MKKILFSILEKFTWIFWIYIIFFVISAFFGGPLPFLKLTINLVLLVIGYWGGCGILWPFFEKIFKNLNWNWNFGIALVALIWLWIFFNIVAIFSQTELGQWLGDLS